MSTVTSGAPAAPPEAVEEPTVDLGAVPLRLALVLRASVAHHAIGLRSWAALPPADARGAPELLQVAEEAQELLERRIVQAGYPIRTQEVGS